MVTDSFLSQLYFLLAFKVLKRGINVHEKKKKRCRDKHTIPSQGDFGSLCQTIVSLKSKRVNDALTAHTCEQALKGNSFVDSTRVERLMFQQLLEQIKKHSR